MLYFNAINAFCPAVCRLIVLSNVFFTYLIVFQPPRDDAIP